MASVTGERLTHTTHLEDLLYNHGERGVELLVSALNASIDMLESGVGSNELKLSTKIDGCFAPDTLVKSDFGVITILEMIQMVRSGDSVTVLGYDMLSGNEVYTTVEPRHTKAGTGDKPWVRVWYEDGSYTDCTEDHLFYTRNNGWKPAAWLTPEDDLLYIS